MLYTVKYRKAGARFWRTIRKVKADATIEGTRIIICEDETRYEFPLAATEFRHSPERCAVIRENMKKERGAE